MDRRKFLLTSLAAPMLAQTSSPETNASEFYELRWFHLRNGEDSPRMLDLFKTHWTAAAKLAGFQAPGFFQPVVGEGGPSVLMLSVFPDAETAATSFDRLMRDAHFAAAYRKANVPTPAFSRMDATLLRAFTGMPRLAVPAGSTSHIFELRTYESNSMVSLAKKLEMFNGGEIEIFRRLGMSPVFFGEAIFGRNLPSLTYMLAFESLAARERAWNAFGSDPGFAKLRVQPGYSDAEIVSSISNTLLHPLPYSSIR